VAEAHTNPKDLGSIPFGVAASTTAAMNLLTGGIYWESSPPSCNTLPRCCTTYRMAI